MGAYLINDVRMRDGVLNHEELAQLKRTVEADGGKWHSDRGEEGPRRALGNAQVLVEFGTMTEAQNWNNSSEYGASRAFTLTMPLILSWWTTSGRTSQWPASPRSGHSRSSSAYFPMADGSHWRMGLEPAPRATLTAHHFSGERAVPARRIDPDQENKKSQPTLALAHASAP
jgi:uncharacterized protein (DUF1330 family)